MRPVVRFDGHVGERVDRAALFEQPAEGLLGIGGAQQRPVRALAHPAQQHLEIGLQPYRDAGLADALARRLVEEGAAAGRQNLGPLDEQPRDHPALALAKIGFAEALENLRDRHLRARLDFGVGIDEGQAEALGEPLADGGLSRAHHAHEHDRTPAKSGGEPFGVNTRGFVHAILPNARSAPAAAPRVSSRRSYRNRPPMATGAFPLAKGRLARRAKTCKHTSKA